MLFGHTVTAAGCPESQYKEADHAFTVATDFITAKNWPESIPSLESALAICPDHINSLRYLGKAYYATDRFEDAQATQEKLVEVAGQDAKSGDYMDLGKTYAKVKDYRKARQAYVNANRIDPDNCSILFNLAVMHGAVNDHPRSVEAYEQVLDNCPDLREKVMPNLVKACQKAAERERSVGNVAEARLYEAKREEYGSQAGGSVGYQVIADKMKAKDWTGAVDQCKAFLANNPESSRRDNVLLNLARSSHQLAQEDAAIEAYRQHLVIKPGNGKAAEELIVILAAQSRCDEALTAAEAAGVHATDDLQKAYLFYGWGKALECAGRYQEAKEKFRWVAANATGDYQFYARKEMTRQDELEERRRLQRENAGY
ncbi:tetratricopeptide repeat protein [bacterium]|nr:tetratricopeptide repeat protein [bacterium]MBU1676874.1 tetratricopeptide repeat protein [bacterium]